MKRILFILARFLEPSAPKQGPRRRREGERTRERRKAHSSISPAACALEISPHMYARNIQRSVAALGGFNPSKLIPFSRSIAHSLCFVLHQLGYAAQLPLFPWSTHPRRVFASLPPSARPAPPRSHHGFWLGALPNRYSPPSTFPSTASHPPPPPPPFHTLEKLYSSRSTRNC